MFKGNVEIEDIYEEAMLMGRVRIVSFNRGKYRVEVSTNGNNKMYLNIDFKYAQITKRHYDDILILYPSGLGMMPKGTDRMILNIKDRDRLVKPSDNDPLGILPVMGLGGWEFLKKGPVRSIIIERASKGTYKVLVIDSDYRLSGDIVQNENKVLEYDCTFSTPTIIDDELILFAARSDKLPDKSDALVVKINRYYTLDKPTRDDPHGLAWWFGQAGWKAAKYN